MRQRKIKNLEEKYEAYDKMLVYDPEKMKGDWQSLANGRPIYMEILLKGLT